MQTKSHKSVHADAFHDHDEQAIAGVAEVTFDAARLLFNLTKVIQ